MSEELTMLEAATNRFQAAKADLEDAKDELVAAIVAALRTGAEPVDVAKRAPFTPRYIRQIAREHGIEPSTPGPKPQPPKR